MIEAQIGCLDRCNNSMILRKAFGPNEYLNSPKTTCKKEKILDDKINHA